MAAILRDLALVAPSRLTVLLEGPTGCGKEVAARDLHRLSGRRGPLVAVNCAAFAEGTVESELFGHVRGAFTGAREERSGAVASAEGGTLFLDEVGDLPSRLQALLLRVLQEREVRPVGCDRPRTVDVRFVAATNRPLDVLAREGRFRPDLLYRLRGAQVRLPPLAERRHEFPFLVPELARRVCEESGLPAPRLRDGVVQALARHAWPGNFRQLRAALERAAWRSHGERVELRHFPELEEPDGPAGTWAEATRDFQRGLLERTLVRSARNVAAAARELGMSRQAFYAAARRLGIPLHAVASPGNGAPQSPA